MNDKETLDQIHIICHSIRLISGYKPSEAEKKIGKIIREHYSSQCKECDEIDQQIKSTPPKPVGITQKLKEAITGGI